MRADQTEHRGKREPPPLLMNYVHRSAFPRYAHNRPTLATILQPKLFTTVYQPRIPN
jgi:hypothetical protein